MTAEPPRPLTYGAARPPSGQIWAPVRWGFDAAVDRLKRAIDEQGLWLIHELDPQAIVRRAGYAIPAARQLLFFHPRFMAAVLSTNPAAIVEAPLKLIVLEDKAAGGEREVRVHVPDPRAQFGRYPGLAPLGDELGEICGRLLDAIR